MFILHLFLFLSSILLQVMIRFMTALQMGTAGQILNLPKNECLQRNAIKPHCALRHQRQLRRTYTCFNTSTFGMRCSANYFLCFQSIGRNIHTMLFIYGALFSHHTFQGCLETQDSFDEVKSGPVLKELMRGCVGWFSCMQFLISIPQGSKY